jgi:hypothetical protein
MVTIVPLTGQETDEQLEQIAWAMWCHAHPHEAYAHDPEAFWKFFQGVVPNADRAAMVAMLKETEE